MLFKVGDVVTIRPDLTCKELYGNVGGDDRVPIGVNSYMTSLAGKKATIVKVEDNRRYRIDLDGSDWSWKDGMFVIKEEYLLTSKFEVRPDIRPFRKYGGVTFVPPMSKHCGKTVDMYPWQGFPINIEGYVFTKEMFVQVKEAL